MGNMSYWSNWFVYNSEGKEVPATPITLKAEEVAGDVATDDFVLVATSEELGGPEVGAQLTGGAILIGGGLSFLVVGGAARDFQVRVEELEGDADTTAVWLHLPKDAFGGAGPAIGTEYAGARYDLTAGPVLIVPLEGAG